MFRCYPISRCLGFILECALAMVLASPLALADGTWIDAEAASDSAVPAAETLAKSLATKLKLQKLATVFLDIAGCDGPQEPKHSDWLALLQKSSNAPANNTTSGWCATFPTILENALNERAIRFLRQDTKDQIRTEIAKEEVYQHQSLQVEKAVELGKQLSFDAFVTVTVKDAGSGKFQIAAKVVNIKSGVVTISKVVQLQTKIEQPLLYRSLGWTTVTLGVGAAIYGGIMASAAKTRSDQDYKTYQEASSADTADSSHKRVVADDLQVARYNTIAAIGGSMAVLGGLYLWLGEKSDLSYRVDSLSTKSGKLGANGGETTFWVRPLLNQRMAGLNIGFNF